MAAANDAVITITSSQSVTDAVDFASKEKQPYIVTEEVEPSSLERPQLTRNATGRRRLSSKCNFDDQSDPEVEYEEGTLKWLGRLYLRILNFHLVTRFFIYSFPITLALAIPLILFATVYHDTWVGDERHGKVRILGLFVWLEIVWAGLWIGKLAARVIPHIFQFFSGMVSATTRKWTEFLRALEVPLSLLLLVIVAWATTPVIVAFNPETMIFANSIMINGTLHDQSYHHYPSYLMHTHMDDNDDPWPYMLKRFLLATIPAACVWFVEKVAIRLLAVNYHQTQFHRKIQESAHTINLITELYTASRTLFEPFCVEFEEEDYMINNSMVGNTHVGKLENIQARAVFGGLARLSSGVTSAFNSIASEVAGGRKIDPNSDKGVVLGALQKACSSAALGRRLWMSLAEAGKDALYERDIIRVLGENRQADAEMIFRDLDKDRNGDVSLEEMEGMLVDFEKAQKAMLKSMHDVKSSVAALDRILMAAAVVITAGVYAAFFSHDFLKNLAVATTSIMSFSFAFAGTVQEFAGSCIFLFVKHPYDVDDRVDINGIEMIVKHISLLYTVFDRIDTNRTVQIPNIVNNSNWIENVTRSGAMRERIKISIDSTTTADDINLFREELQEFVLKPENKRDFMPTVLVDVNAIGDFKSLELTIEYTHKSNWSNEMLRLTRRSKFLAAVIENLRAVPIAPPGGNGPALGERGLPSYSVAVSDEEAQAAKAKHDADAQAAKLANKKERNVLDPEDAARRFSRKASAISVNSPRGESGAGAPRRSSEFVRGVRRANASISNPSAGAEYPFTR